jgi:plastocyanin
MSKKVLLQKSKLSELSLQQIAEDVSSEVSVDNYKILKNQNLIIFDGDDQDRLYTEIKALECGKVTKDHSNFQFHAQRTTIAPGTSNRYWHLDAISRLDYNHSTGSNGTFSTINNGEDVDIYIIDSGIQGASRPTGTDAALHPELFDPQYVTDLNGATEQAFYRVHELPVSLYDPGTTNGNDPQSTSDGFADGHGTFCAIMAAGRYAGVANKSKVYSLRISSDAGVIFLSKMVEAYEAIYRHNDPDDSEYKGNTLDGNTRPRPSVVNVSIGATAPHPKAPYIDRNENYTGNAVGLTASASSINDYTINGTDAATTHTNALDPNITVNAGDTLTITTTAGASHPMSICVEGTTTYSEGARVAAGVTGQGETNGDIVIDTTALLAGERTGSFVYICQSHSAMRGTITVNDANSPTSSNVNEVLDDGEFIISSQKGVTVTRSAGNGMKFIDPDTDPENKVDYGPQNTKITYGSRNAGKSSLLDPEISFTAEYNRNTNNADKFVVGATKIGANNKQTFADFTNYGEAVTCYAPGQSIIIPNWNWDSGDDYTSQHMSISGTSFSAPLVAGMVAVWKQIHDGPMWSTNVYNASLATEEKFKFSDYTDTSVITQNPVGNFQNPTNASDGAIIARSVSTSSGATWYRFSTTSASNNVVMQLTDAEWNALSPAQNDVIEFEFPRIQENNTVGSNGLATEYLRDAMHLGERKDYNVAVVASGGGNVYEIARVQNGIAGTAATQPTLQLDDGVVYRFDQSDVSNATHGISISITGDGTHSGGSSFQDYVSTLSGSSTKSYKNNLRYFKDEGTGPVEIDQDEYNPLVGQGPAIKTWFEWVNPTNNTHPKVDSSLYASQFHYYCVNHPNMGGVIDSSANIPSNVSIGGIDLKEFSKKWRKIQSVDSANKTITFHADTNATGTEEGGGGPFAQADEITDLGAWPRYPMRFSKITGTWFANDAVWNWTENYSSVIYPSTKYNGNAFVAGEFYAQLESDEGISDGELVEYFPIPKGRLVREGISGNDVQKNQALQVGARWGNGTETNPRLYTPLPSGQSTVTYDGGQGIFFPFIDLTATWSDADGSSLGTISHGSVVNRSISLTSVSTFAGDTIAAADREQNYELVSGGSNSAFTQNGSVYTFTDNNLIFNASTGLLSGTANGGATATTYQFTVKETTSQATVTYYYDVLAAPVTSTISITTQPPATFTGDASFPVNQDTIAITIAATDSISSVLTYQWQVANNLTEANANTWTDLVDNEGISGSSTVTVNIPDKVENDGKYYRCKVDSTTAPSSVFTTSVLAVIDPVITCKVLWNAITTVYATGSLALLEIESSVTDGSTPTLTLSYDTARFTVSGVETDITSTNYDLVPAGYNSQAGNPMYFARLGENSYNTASVATGLSTEYETDDDVYLKVTAASGSVTQDAVSLFSQQIVPCLSLIDENSNQTQSQLDTDWTSFRNDWPDRPFHLLHVKNSGGTGWDTLTTPTGTVQGTDYFYYQIERDPATALTSYSGYYDWFTLTGMDTLASGATVALFIDNSGSMQVADVADQLAEFEADCTAAGITIIRVENGNEEYVEPFITTLTVNEPNPYQGPFTVEKAYNLSADLPNTLDIPKQTNTALSASWGVENNTGINAATVIWYYKSPTDSSFSKLLATNLASIPWYVSGYGTQTLTINFPDDTYTGYSFYAVGYNDFLGTSGADDTDDIAKYSGVNTGVLATNVSPYTVSTITNPPGVTNPEETISETSATLNSSEYLITVVSDNLPDPAQYGTFPNDNNSNQISAQSFNHTFHYRGGSNTSALSPVTDDMIGITTNGTPIYSSKISGNLTGDTSSAAGVAPAGFNWNAGWWTFYQGTNGVFGADAAGGYTDASDTYIYRTGKFSLTGTSPYTAEMWDGIERSNPYYRTGSYNGDYLRHTDGHSKIIGIAFDGHPIYGTYGYSSAGSNSSSVVRMTSSYALYASEEAGRTYTYGVIPAGQFVEDYQFISNSGSLDKCNGRYCVTPEYPNGTYAYFVSTDTSGVNTYPYIIGPFLRQSYNVIGGLAPTDPGGTNLQGPGNGGFDIKSTFTTGITIEAVSGASTRQIYAYESVDANDPVTYQWQRSADNSTWVNIGSGDNGYSDYTTNTLTINDTDKSVDDQFIRLQVTDSLNVVASSEPMSLEYVGSALVIETQPSTVSTYAGLDANFSIQVSTTDSSTVSYIWQYRVNSGSAWYNVSTLGDWSSVNDTLSTLSLPGSTVTTTKINYQFRCVCNSPSAENGPLNSSAASLVVSNTTIAPVGVFHTGTTNPIGAYDEGETISVESTVTPSQNVPVSYSWKRSTDNVTYTSVASGTLYSPNYTTNFTEVANQATLGANQVYYKLEYDIPGVVSNASSPQIATTNIYKSLTINTQPTDLTVYETQPAAFTVTATATSGTETYQWQSYDGVDWNDIAGQTTNTLTISSPTLSDNTNQYRVRVNLTGQDPLSTPPRLGDLITSDSATLLVEAQPTIAITTQPANVSLFQPDIAVFSIVADASDGSTISYQWEQSTDTGTTWNTITGADSNSISTGVTTSAGFNGNQYRCTISHPYGSNSPILSNAAILTVTTPVLSIGTQPQSYNITAGIPVTFSITGSVTSSKQINYQWQQSSDGGINYYDIFDEISNSLTVIGTTNNNGWYYRCVLNSEGATTLNSSAGILSLAYLADPTITTSRFIDTTTSLTFTRSPIIYSSSFQSYIGNGHDVSFWTITRTSDNAIVYQTIDTLPDGDTVQKIELQSPELDWGTQYRVQVKYKDSAGFETAISPAALFTTPIVNQPTFQPVPTSLRPTIILNSIEFNSTLYNHSSTSWQIASSGTFASNVIVYESLDDISNKITITVPESVTLDASRNYYVRAKINLTAI